jgi:hypothetical protein
MKRQITGLHADRDAEDQIPDGIFLVCVQRVQFHRQTPKPYYTLVLAILEPSRLLVRPHRHAPMLQNNPVNTSSVCSRVQTCIKGC